MKKFKKNFLKPFLLVCFGLLIATVAIADNYQCEAPGKPGNLEILNITEEGCRISFTPPVWDGGAAILGYVVERRGKEGRWQIVLETFSTDVTFFVASNNIAEEVQFRISAKNVTGRGEPSDPTQFILFRLK